MSCFFASFSLQTNESTPCNCTALRNTRQLIRCPSELRLRSTEDSDFRWCNVFVDSIKQPFGNVVRLGVLVICDVNYWRWTVENAYRSIAVLLIPVDIGHRSIRETIGTSADLVRCAIVDRLLDRERTFLPHAVRQIGSLHVLHHQEMGAATAAKKL